MEEFTSIKTKMVSSSVMIIFVLFIVVLAVITYINIINVNENVKKSEKWIHTALIAKGSTLSNNNSMAIRGMAEDYAFTAIQALVSSTVKDDDDITYGIYMDVSQMPWAYADQNNPLGVPKDKKPLSDMITQWVAKLKILDHRIHNLYNNHEVIEFAAPIYVDNELSGWIRYGISTKSMHRAIKDVRENGRRSRNQMILILSLIGLFALVSSFFIIRSQASKMTKPINNLVEFSKIMSEGNYNVTVQVTSNDEIGQLADQFESMRVTIKKYTNHLQELVDEKMQQVKDILDNIDQGLFTVNLDGTINEEYSARTNNILKVEDITKCDLPQLLRMDGKQQKEFDKWLAVVQRRHKKQRWKKLTNLAPVKELELVRSMNEDSMDYVSVSYQKIFNMNNQLSKIMILVVDETEKRFREQQMMHERLSHENDVKMILGIANTPPEEVAEFMEDTYNRLNILEKRICSFHEQAKEQRQKYPDGPELILEKNQIDMLYRDIHTIKGNAGSYGFELLSVYAHQAEDQLELLRKGGFRRDHQLQLLFSNHQEMKKQYDTIREKIKLLFGKQEDLTIPVPQIRVQTIVDLCNNLKQQQQIEEVERLIKECDMLTWKPLSAITRKYQKIAQKSAERLKKNIEVNIQNDKSLFPPQVLTDIDEALIHLFRNAVDHGIEPPEVREEFGKGIGHIGFEFSSDHKGRVIRVSDDGNGIDTERLVTKSIENGELTNEQATVLNKNQKLSLVYTAGLTTSEEITDISGRGIGMDVVKSKVESLGGNIEINSMLGKGTTFTLEIPPFTASPQKEVEST